MKLKSYREDNDCTVFALASATGVSYETALRHMNKSGRKKDSSVPTKITDKAFKNSNLGGYKITKVYSRSEKWRTLDGSLRFTYRKFLKSKYLFPRCIIRLPGHVVAIIKDKLYQFDIPGDRQEICTVWKVSR
jgi:hypothetical protein